MTAALLLCILSCLHKETPLVFGYQAGKSSSCLYCASTSTSMPSPFHSTCLLAFGHRLWPALPWSLLRWVFIVKVSLYIFSTCVSLSVYQFSSLLLPGNFCMSPSSIMPCTFLIMSQNWSVCLGLCYLYINIFFSLSILFCLGLWCLYVNIFFPFPFILSIRQCVLYHAIIVNVCLSYKFAILACVYVFMCVIIWVYDLLYIFTLSCMQDYSQSLYFIRITREFCALWNESLSSVCLCYLLICLFFSLPLCLSRPTAC